MYHTVTHVVLLQITWFACALSGPWDMLWMGPAAMALFIPYHCRYTGTWRLDIRALLWVCAIGTAADSLQRYLGVLTFPHPQWLPDYLIPSWMIAIWANFACALRGPLVWLKGRYLLGAALGLIGAPMAYRGGQSLGALEFGSDTTGSLIAIGLEWTILIPLLIWVIHGSNGGDPADDKNN